MRAREGAAVAAGEASAAGHTATANDDVIAALDVKTPGPVDALLGAGHGHQAQTDAAGTGLMVGLTPVAHASGGEPLPKTFGAHDLPQIQRVRRLLLSCCTLGRTESVLGEALGMAATAFAYDTRWAVGYLIPVGDLEATLFSAALQWGIAQLPDEQYADDAAWRAVFEHTRETIHEGRWPDGVGAFLREVLPTALAHAAPSTARTSAPWRKQWAAAVCDYAAMLNVDDRGRAWAREEGEALTAALAELAARLAACPPKSLVAMMPWVICLGG